MVIPCATSESRMFPYFYQRYTGKEHIKGNQQNKNVKFKNVTAQKKGYPSFSTILNKKQTEIQ